MKGTDLKDFKDYLFKDKKTRIAYEALNPKCEIIQTIIARRNELSLSQRDLARMIGIQQPAICRLKEATIISPSGVIQCGTSFLI